MVYKKLCIGLVLTLLLFVSAYGQESVVQIVPFTGDSLTYVNWQIIADTTANGGILPNRVYEFARDGIYLANRIFTVPIGSTLRLRGADGSGAKPIIYLWESGTGGSPTRPPGNFVVLNGANLEIRNICVAGYYEPEPDRVDGVQGGLINTSAPGNSIILDGVLFSNINGQHVRTGHYTTKVQVTNSIFANMGALTTSNLGAGKGIDFRDVAVDTVIIQNNTFVNYQDRALRHYNFGDPQAGTGNFGYLKVDHNTFVNGMGFHGLLSLGNLGSSAIITNNLFVDAFALGEDSSDATRTAEWANTGEVYPNGNNRITWIFSAPNDTTQWTVSNNYYTLSSEGQGWLDEVHFGHGPFPVGSQLSWHINSRLGADSVSAFTMESGLALTETPNLMTNMMTWYEDPAGGNRIKDQTNFDKATDDYDRRVIEYYRDTLDASYSTSALAYTGGQGRFPAGDLNWFPDKKTEWESYTPLDIVVDAEKDAFYGTLTGPDDGYLQIRSFSNSDNGAPVDDADLSSRVWAAWDNDWFYLYEEVMDDTVSAAAANDYLVDCLELKFDPQATDSTNTGTSIYGINLTALDTSTAGVTVFNNLNGIPNAKWARKIISGGYSLELGLPWSVITANSENVSVGIDNVFGLGINNHDNDGNGRQASITWAAVLLDHIWDTPKYLGTVKFLADNKVQFIPTNNMTGVTNNTPYDGSTDVEQNSSLIPNEFSLSQNYPNPFNPSTTIGFAIPKQAVVELVVYNLLGERVAVLVNEELNAGYYHASFDAHALTSGVYFYRIQAGSFVQTKKLLLLK